MSWKYGTDLTTSQSLPGIPIPHRRLIAPPHTADSSHRLLTADSSPPTPHRQLLIANSFANSSSPIPRRRLLSALVDKVVRILSSSRHATQTSVPSLTSLSSRSSSAPRSSSPLRPPRTLRSQYPYPSGPLVPRTGPHASHESTIRIGCPMCCAGDFEHSPYRRTARTCSPVMCTPNVARPNTAQAARSSGNAALHMV